MTDKLSTPKPAAPTSKPVSPPKPATPKSSDSPKPLTPKPVAVPKLADTKSSTPPKPATPKSSDSSKPLSPKPADAPKPADTQQLNSPQSAMPKSSASKVAGVSTPSAIKPSDLSKSVMPKINERSRPFGDPKSGKTHSESRSVLKPVNGEKSNLRTDEVLLKDLKPNSTYKNNTNGFEYKTDAKGRTSLVFGEHLKLYKNVHRSSQQGKVGKIGKPGDVGAHYAGARFGGTTDAYNLASLNKYLNNSTYKKMENEWAKAIKNKSDVSFLLEPKFNKNDRRPTSLDVVYQIDGKLHQKRFRNSALKSN